MPVTDPIAGRREAGPAPAVLELRSAVGHLVRRAQQRHTALWTAEFGGDLTGPQYAVISAVSAQAGLDQAEIGVRTSLDKSSIADIVARLADQGWLRFARDPDDGRRKALWLTAVARAALGDVTRRAGRVQSAVLQPLPADRAGAFLDALRLVAYAGDVPPLAAPPDVPVLVLRDTPGHLIRRAQQVHTSAWAEEVGRVLTAPQYAVLSALWHQADEIDQATTGELASLDKSSTADVVARLVRRGLVNRAADPADGRRRMLRLTDDARSTLPDLTRSVLRVQERVTAPLAAPAELDTFLAGCTALAYAE